MALPQRREATIRRFYDAFSKRDWAGMAACYETSDDLTFEDPAFGLLKGDRVTMMWRMLCERASDDFCLEYDLGNIQVDDEKDSAAAHWEAHYTFSSTKRKVHNIVSSHFEFLPNGDKILHQKDSFDMWAWTRQALGLVGLLAGWTPMLKSKVQSDANANLDKFIKRLASPSPQ
eukprot:ANDGO_03671.mRNA.1 hypothetical protein